jgi:hypothetical protein
MAIPTCRRLAVAIVLLFPAISGAQTLDRMVAIVDGEVVTLSDIQDYRTLNRGFGEEVSDDDSEILEQVIEDMLIGRQIAQFPGNAISSAELEAYLTDFMDTGELSDGRLEVLARRRLELERYYQSLSRSLRATETEVRALYENEFVPDWQGREESPPPAFAQVRGALAEIVVADKLVGEIALRVDLLYRRYRVEIVE